MDHLFVFGTLKLGFRNHPINRGRRLPGRFVTQQSHPLYIVGTRCLPWLLDRPGQGQRVFGEVYAVDADALAHMDELERVDTPGWYERRRIGVTNVDNGEYLEPWVYFGSESGFEPGAVLVGPIDEYRLEHQTRYQPRAEG